MPTLGLFGRLAVDLGMITEEQLQDAVRAQGVDPSRGRLGDILVARGALRPEQLAELTDAQDRFRTLLLERRLTDRRGDGGRSALRAATEAVGDACGDARGGGLDPLLARNLRAAWDCWASDLHLHSGSTPFLRVDGRLRTIDVPPPTTSQVREMLRSIASPEHLERLQREGDVDFAWQLGDDARFRINAFVSDQGLGISLRIVPMEVPTLEELGLPTILARCAGYHQGLVLVTGPSGCGKTSTVAALVRLINEERRHHVITVEDPIEFVHRPIRANILQRQIGEHVESFAGALRGALRQDPDVIVVGEMRDIETIALAMSAAETGHLVLGTMHTTGAVGTVDRLVGSFPPPQQPQARAMLAESLRAIVSQRLLARADGKGRVPAIELMFNTPAVSNLVRESRTYQLPNLIQLGRSLGMRRFEDSMRELAIAGLIRPSEVHRGAS